MSFWPCCVCVNAALIHICIRQESIHMNSVTLAISPKPSLKFSVRMFSYWNMFCYTCRLQYYYYYDSGCSLQAFGEVYRSCAVQATKSQYRESELYPLGDPQGRNQCRPWTSGVMWSDRRAGKSAELQRSELTRACQGDDWRHRSATNSSSRLCWRRGPWLVSARPDVVNTAVRCAPAGERRNTIGRRRRCALSCRHQGFEQLQRAGQRSSIYGLP